MADNVVRSRQDFSGQYRSEGPQFVGNTIDTAGGSIYLTSDSMSDAVIVPSLVCRLSRAAQARRSIILTSNAYGTS